MATYTTKKCPNCNMTYERYSTYTKNYANHSGSPFVTCRYCGQTFLDKDIKEPALKPFDDEDLGIIGCILGLLFPFGIVGIGLTVALFYFGFDIGLLVFALLIDALYIFLVVKSYQSRAEVKEKLRREYEESLERLRDIDYARALKKAGFRVPKKFLEPSNDVVADASPDSAIETVNEFRKTQVNAGEPDQEVDNSLIKLYCKSCGAKLLPESKFCNQCGKEV